MHRHLKTAILALTAVLLVAAALLAAGKPKASLAEPIYEGGNVPKGDKLTHDFLIKNEGDADLQITNVQPACGCTVVSFDKVVKPGQTGKVHAVLDSSTFTGPIAKGITVFTNDPDHPQIELTIKGNVAPYITVKPGYARYITVQGEAVEGKITQTLFAPDGSSFKVTSVESPYPYLKVDFHEAKPEERLPEGKGTQWKVDMTLSNDAKVGALADFVVIHTDHPKQKVVQIPISGFVRPVLAITPPVADFGQITLKEPLKKALFIRNFATEPIKVTSIDTKLPKGIDAKLESVQEGREYQVRVVLNPELGKGPFNGSVTIHTDSPKVPVVEVPFKGTVI